MIPQTPTRREAEEFAAVIDGPSRSDVADRYAELTRTVTMLREQPRPMPRPEFVLDLRERLLAAADTEFAPTPVATVSPISPARRRLATVAAAAVLVGGTAGMAAAAQSTIPGDNLYPIKRGLENIQAQLSTNDGARGRDLLSQAGTRVDEAQKLMAQPQTAHRDALIRSALASATGDADQGSTLLFRHYQTSRSASDISTVRGFASQQMTSLGTIAGQLGLSQSVVGNLGDALSAIDQQARVLCSGCSTLPPITLPADVLKLTSADSVFAPLVTVPTTRATQLEKLAAQAQHVANSIGSTGTPASTVTHTGTAVGSPSGTTATPTKTPTSKPVGDLLTGLTNGSKSVPGQLATTVNGITQTVTGVVSGTTGALTQTVTGLLGGLTAQK